MHERGAACPIVSRHLPAERLIIGDGERLRLCRGVRSSKPLPSLTEFILWQPAATQLTAQSTSITNMYFSIGLAPLFDVFHGLLQNGCALDILPSLRAAGSSRAC